MAKSTVKDRQNKTAPHKINRHKEAVERAMRYREDLERKYHDATVEVARACEAAKKDKITMGTLAEWVGMTRQSLHVMLTKLANGQTDTHPPISRSPAPRGKINPDALLGGRR